MSRITWKTVLVITVALAIGVCGAAFASDAVADDPEDAVAPTATARPVPVLASGTGAALSEAVALYAVEEWSSPTRGLVLGAWGAAFAGLIGDDELPDDVPDAAFVDDPRVSDPTGSPSFVDPCAGAAPGDPLPADCPDDGVPGQVLDPDGDSPPGNSVALFAFPAADVALAAECPFPDVQADEIPIAVITGNPGTIEVHIGSQQVEVDSDDLETDEWETWLDEPVGPRPPETFVAHCIAIPDPPGDGPVRIVAVAEDDAGQLATAETTVARMPDALPPPTMTPIDATMVRIDVPLPAGTDAAAVVAVPVSVFGFGPPSCAAIPGPLPAPSGWRLGTTTTSEVAPPPGDRPYLDDAPRVQRVTLALPEGEPSLLCITRPGDAGPTTSGFVTTPPDARRLDLRVSSLELAADVDADAISVRGTFAELGWTPCGALLPAADTPAGTVDPAADGALCTSGGDTGAIAAAGGVLDISVRVGTAVHQVRIGLSAVPGGQPVDNYRIPIPAADFDGTLCTDGVDQPGCTEPEGDAVLGTLQITATWDEGPLGPAEWQVNPPAPS